MTFLTNKISGLNGFQLKMIAIVTMIVDHVGAVLFPEHLIFRYIGRLSFPIFCFLLVEGFVHTRNVYKYMVRLGIFAVVSEIPYDLAFRDTIFELEKQNVFFTLCLGVGILYLLKYTNGTLEKGIYMLFAMGFAEILKSDYGAFGILLIIMFYLFYENEYTKLACGAAWNFFAGGTIQYYGALAMLPIAIYNGKKGYGLKYFFYLFYPAHLLLLYGIQKYML